MGWPAPVRDSVPVNAIVPAVGPEQAHAAVVRSGCRTAKVKVADHAGFARPTTSRGSRRSATRWGRPVRCGSTPTGPGTSTRRSRPSARWTAPPAGWSTSSSPARTIDELAAVRRRVDVRIAADESIRRADDPLRVAVAGAADVAVLKCTPLGGVARALRVAEAAGLPCVVSSALETSVGLAAEVALAAALPELEFACGLGTLALLDGDLVPDADGLRPVDGQLPVACTPPAPDPALLDAHRPRDPERARWWLDRLARTARILGLPNL